VHDVACCDGDSQLVRTASSVSQVSSMLILLRYRGRGDGGYGSTCGEKMLTGKPNAEATRLGDIGVDYRTILKWI
jgi:hypothetical protein